MKKSLKYFLIALLFLPLLSCGDDKEKDEPAAGNSSVTGGANPTESTIKSLIVGKWEFIYEDEEEGSIGFEFRSDNSGNYYDLWEDYFELEPITYYVKGNKIITYFGYEKVEYHVDFITSNKLILTLEDDYDDDIFVLSRVKSFIWE